ncbi:MAG: hypothetical protein ABUK08_00140 [Candidatus Humimicrobiaceae bacterium]
MKDKEFFIKMDGLEVVKEVDEDDVGNFVLIQKLEDITGYLTDDEIHRLYKGIFLGAYSWEKDLTVDELAEKCYKAIQGKDEGKDVKKKPVKKKEPSKLDFIRGVFEHRQVISEKDLCTMTGLDKDSLKTYVNMISNKILTKNSLNIIFSETKLNYKIVVDK